MKLSKKEKIKAYEAVMDCLNNSIGVEGEYYEHPSIPNIGGFGVCEILCRYSAHIKKPVESVADECMDVEFPEIMAYKPKKPTANFWLVDAESRKEVVTEILTELKK